METLLDRSLSAFQLNVFHPTHREDVSKFLTNFVLGLLFQIYFKLFLNEANVYDY